MAIPIAYIMSSSHDGLKGCKRTPSIIEERKLNVAQLLFLASVDPKADISLYLNTPGGQPDRKPTDILSSKWTIWHFYGDKKSIIPALVPALQYP